MQYRYGLTLFKIIADSEINLVDISISKVHHSGFSLRTDFPINQKGFIKTPRVTSPDSISTGLVLKRSHAFQRHLGICMLSLQRD